MDKRNKILLHINLGFPYKRVLNELSGTEFQLDLCTNSLTTLKYIELTIGRRALMKINDKTRLNRSCSLNFVYINRPKILNLKHIVSLKRLVDEDKIVRLFESVKF